jgi:hypothetical protein
MENKKCDKCSIKLPLSSFDQESYGYRSVCKTCRYKRLKEVRELKKLENNKTALTITEKICKTCSKSKAISEFNKRSLNNDGYLDHCRECYSKVRKIVKDGKDEHILQKIVETKKCNTCLVKKNISDFKETSRSIDGHYNKCKSCWKPTEWNKDKQKASEKKYVENNPEKMKLKWQKAGFQVNRRIRDSLNHRIKDAFNSVSIQKLHKTMEYVGCDKSLLKKWFLYQFEDGMTFDNYGEWHIDHVKPCSSFNLENEDEIKECFNWRNLRPCWKQENLEKNCSIIPEVIESHKQKVNKFISINPLPNQPGDRVGGAE